MPTILVVNSGDGTGLNFVRCLRSSGSWIVVGLERSVFDYHVSEADIRYVFEWGNDQDLLNFVAELLKRHRVDLLYVADTGRELTCISQHRMQLTVPVFLPDLVDHLRMEDKWATWLALRSARLPVPETVLVTDPDVLLRMIDRYPMVWLRRVRGSAGAGAVATDSLDFATAWVERHRGWGEFTAAERLSDRTATFTGLWYRGELVASQLRERLGWQYAALTVSGVTGITGSQRTIWDKALHATAIASVRALNARPHGAIGVDFTYDHDGDPRITEVQPARFYASMQFLAEAGINFPAMYCDIALNGPRHLPRQINPIRDDLYWVKAVDRKPQLLTRDEYHAYE